MGKAKALIGVLLAAGGAALYLWSVREFLPEPDPHYLVPIVKRAFALFQFYIDALAIAGVVLWLAVRPLNRWLKWALRCLSVVLLIPRVWELLSGLIDVGGYILTSNWPSATRAWQYVFSLNTVAVAVTVFGVWLTFSGWTRRRAQSASEIQAA